MKQKCRRELHGMLMPLIIGFILLFSGFSNTEGVRANGPDYSAMYDFSGGVITGFKTTYLDSLPEKDGYKYVDITIPSSIDGTSVTGIGSSAFLGNKSIYKNVRVQHIDLSKADHLTSIGAQAFYAMDSMYSQMESCTLTLPDTLETIGNWSFADLSALKGSLVIPNGVTSVGNSAFRNCGFDGTLTLPDNSGFTQITGQVFENCSFTGTLTIPDAVTVISSDGSFAFSGNRFTKLVLPDHLTKIGGSAFKDCTSLKQVNVKGKTEKKEVIHLPDTLTELGSNIFSGCNKLTGSVKLPDSLTSVGSQIFEGSSVKTIYMPDSSKVVYKSNFLFNTPVNAAVFPSKALYEKYKTTFNSGARQYFGYPVTVTFLGQSDENLGTRDVLFNRPINYHETDNGWEPDEAFQFPDTGASKPGYDTGFAFSKSAASVIGPKTVVSGETLYFRQSISAPDIKLKEVKSKVYDGKTEYIRCEAFHPLVGDGGPYAFFYCVKKASEGKFFYASNTPFEYPVADVADSAQYVCYVQMYDKDHPEYRGKWAQSVWYDYAATQVSISKADVTINPTASQQELAGTLVTDIKLSASKGDTSGTLTWDDPDAVITEGKNTLQWTFIPDKKENYKSESVSGKLEVNGALKSDTGDVETSIDRLPDQVQSDEDAREVLNIWRKYATLTLEEKETVKDGQRENILEALSQVPGIEVSENLEADQVAFDSGQKALYLSCLTADDARKLLDGSAEKFVVNIHTAEYGQNDANIQESLNAALGSYKPSLFYDITLEKQLYAKTEDKVPVFKENVTQLERPVQLRFAIPQELRGSADAKRNFTVFRTHDSGGVLNTSSLKTSVVKGELIVESDCFSIYTVAYSDQTNHEGTVSPKPKAPDNKDKVNATDPGSRNEKKTAAEGSNTGNTSGTPQTTGGTAKAASAETGDPGIPAMWTIISVLSLCLIIGSISARYRRKKL